MFRFHLFFKINYTLLALKTSAASNAYFGHVSKHRTVRLFELI